MKRRRGATLLDVTVGVVLLSLVLAIALQVVVAISESSTTSLLRANARRQAGAATSMLETDFAAAQPCVATRALSPLVAYVAGDFKQGEVTVLAFHADVNADTVPDLVVYTLGADGLRRSVTLGLGECPQFTESTLSSPGFTTVLVPATPTQGSGGLAPSRQGARLSGTVFCDDDPLACRIDAFVAELESRDDEFGVVAVNVFAPVSSR